MLIEILAALIVILFFINWLYKRRFSSYDKKFDNMFTNLSVRIDGLNSTLQVIEKQSDKELSTVPNVKQEVVPEVKENPKEKLKEPEKPKEQKHTPIDVNKWLK